MQGMAVGRGVDLARFEGYGDLLPKLEAMFGIQGELTGTAKKWQVVYTDDEDDMMLVGDDPWHEFLGMVRKIYICTTEEAKRLAPKARLQEVISDPTKPGGTSQQTASGDDGGGPAGVSDLVEQAAASPGG